MCGGSRLDSLYCISCNTLYWIGYWWLACGLEGWSSGGLFLSRPFSSFSPGGASDLGYSPFTTAYEKKQQTNPITPLTCWQSPNAMRKLPIAPDNCWWLPTTAGSSWQLFTAHDNCRELPTTTNSSWKQLTAPNNCRQLLTTSDSSWQLLTAPDNCW